MGVRRQGGTGDEGDTDDAVSHNDAPGRAWLRRLRCVAPCEPLPSLARGNVFLATRGLARSECLRSDGSRLS